MATIRWVAALGALCLAAAAGCTGASTAATSAQQPTTSKPAAAVVASPHKLVLTKHQLLHGKKKMYGLSVPGAPDDMSPLLKAGRQAHKRPSAVLYYQDWTHPFDVSAASSACQDGVLPVLTWESWSWEDTANGATNVTQPDYAPRLIAGGKYDPYIRSVAKQIKSLNCPLLLRFDHEVNGHWYPWGIRTAGMNNTPADYIAMWRHVWRIFHNNRVNNVIWMWAPNFILPFGKPFKLSGMYPGSKYVDMIGIDGYLENPGDTASVYSRTYKQLRKFVPNKRWVIAETGVKAGSNKPTQIRGLLHRIATDKELDGFMYLDQQTARGNWSIDDNSADLKAFRKGVAAKVFAAG